MPHPSDPAPAGDHEPASDPAPAQAAAPAPSPAAPLGPAPLPAREGAIEAYCLELCGAERMRVALEEVIASPRLSAPLATVPEHELLRVARATASGFAPIVHQPGVRSASTQAGTRECGFTIPRLARRDNGELDRYSDAALRAHLEGCLICRAAEARHDRAERAFAAVLGLVIASPPPAPEATVAPDVVEEPDPPPDVVEEPDPPTSVEEPPPTPPVPEAEATVAAPPPPVLPLVAPQPVLPDEPPPLEPEAAEPEPLEPEAAEDSKPVENEHHPEQMRGLVVMPAAPATAAPSARAATAPPLSVHSRSEALGPWRMLIATLIAGVVVILLIALLWSNGSSGPDPHALPPAPAASSAVSLSAKAPTMTIGSMFQ